MVKHDLFQQDLFDFKYIEDQVSSIKQSMQDVEKLDSEKDIKDMLNEQLAILHDINNRLEKITENEMKKKRWFNFFT